jgi:uncharacterized protein
MYLNLRERKHLCALLSPYLSRDEVQKMKQFIQHGSVTTYEHCLRVTERSYWLGRALGLRLDEKALVKGAMLHDFYLYDWHEKRKGGKIHGFTHPHAACEMAVKHFPLTKKEANIIRSHMWPLTLFHVPRSREAWLVSLADKWCSVEETLAGKR